jgi:predicted choloylglycine hydrolase
MIKLNARNWELMGTNYEIGQKMGHFVAASLPLKSFHAGPRSQIEAGDLALAKELFDRWCPGLNEELAGFGDALGVSPEQVTYYAMTYLKPRCSQIVLLPGITADGHVWLARSYEYSHEAEDFTLVRTGVAGKYLHLGSSVMLIGRDEGMNECGLAVSMSSCGFPVGAPATMRPPALRGLQFWAVIRALLENCQNVSEALSYLEGLPIAYNINLMLADKSGQAALLETLDGRRAVRRINSMGPTQYLFATNHVLLPELKSYQPQAMRNSVRRVEGLRRYLEQAAGITASDLKTLLLKPYPEGLCFHYYGDYMGTTKSLIMDLNSGEMEICWGGLATNGWQRQRVSQPLEEGQQTIQIDCEKAQPEIFEAVDY